MAFARISGPARDCVRQLPERDCSGCVTSERWVPHNGVLSLSGKRSVVSSDLSSFLSLQGFLEAATAEACEAAWNGKWSGAESTFQAI